MIATAFGIANDTTMTLRRKMQDWLHEAGLQPYTPQLAYFASANPFLYWDTEAKKMRWPAAATKEVARFYQPMFFAYQYYWYGELKLGSSIPNKNALRLKDGPTQDEMSDAEMTGLWADILAWAEVNGIRSPWIMIDESPHREAEGLTPTVKDRIVKLARCARAAGWTVGAAIAAEAQLAYWIDTLPANRWLLEANKPRQAWIDRAGRMPDGEIWLYNYTNNGAFTGLADRLHEYRAYGYLHYSVMPTTKNNKLPHVLQVLGDEPKGTDESIRLLLELRRYDEMEPVEDYPDLGSYLIALADDRQVMQLNPGASLQRMMFLHSFVPTSPEFDVEYMGEAFVAQRAESLQTGEVRVYYAPTWDYNRVSFAVRP